MKFYIVALVYFTLTGVFGILLKTKLGYEFAEGTTILLGHGLLSVIGFVSLTIMGSMYSIVPMLAVVELHVRKKKVPTVLTEMYNEKLARLGFWLSTIGVAGYIASLVGEGHLTSLMTQQASEIALIESTVLFYKILSAIFVTMLAAGVLLFANNIRKMYAWLKD